MAESCSAARFAGALPLPARCVAATRHWRLGAPALPLAALLLALWPHWIWMSRRLTDGSDEPWGLLAVVTVLLLVWNARDELAAPSRSALWSSALLALGAALATARVPPILAAALALLALARLLTALLPRRPQAALTTLLLLALPLVASLQFYLGYPLRLATAHLAAPLLALLGFEVHASGAAFIFDGRTILVDPPCAGIGMLWVGSFTAALLSYLHGAGTRRTALNGAVAAASVFAANVLRNALLFFPEAQVVDLPPVAHPLIGLLAFAAAIGPIVLFAQRGRPTAATAARRGGVRAVSTLPFVGACLAAAVLPAFALPTTVTRDANAAVTGRTSPAWPTHFRGQPLTQLAPTALEARFAQRFPGAVARFSDGEQLLVLRHVTHATRQLHPAADCFRAAGYRIDSARPARAAEGTRWRCFNAARDGGRVRVCERIAASLDDHDAPAYTDVSAWFWAAQLGAAPRAWWAVTLVTPLAAKGPAGAL